MAPTTALGSPGLAYVRKEVGHGGTDQGCTSRKKAESAVEAVGGRLGEAAISIRQGFGGNGSF